VAAGAGAGAGVGAGVGAGAGVGVGAGAGCDETTGCADAGAVPPLGTWPDTSVAAGAAGAAETLTAA
jgi:hypothetical protein